jgi:transcriptional antiterminator NusG
VGKNWYVVHTYAGYEGRVKATILERASQMGLQDRIGQVLVPTEDVIEIKEGKKRTSTRKFFPGYVLVEMDMSNESWQMIKETPKVTGFVGGGAQPIPLTTEEVDTLL